MGLVLTTSTVESTGALTVFPGAPLATRPFVTADKTRSHYVAQSGLKVTAIMAQLPLCVDGSILYFLKRTVFLSNISYGLTFQ